MMEPAATTSAKVGAAVAILRCGRDGIGVEDLAARISALEAAAVATELAARRGGRPPVSSIGRRVSALERRARKVVAVVASSCPACGRETSISDENGCQPMRLTFNDGKEDTPPCGVCGAPITTRLRLDT